MDGGFGIETPPPHAQGTHRPPARTLVVIDASGFMVARLFGPTREPAGEFDAGTEEVATMTQGLVPVHGALGAEWDRALDGHNADERAAAEVYTLPL